jgi:hypothetical protein
MERQDPADAERFAAMAPRLAASVSAEYTMRQAEDSI